MAWGLFLEIIYHAAMIWQSPHLCKNLENFFDLLAPERSELGNSGGIEEVVHDELPYKLLVRSERDHGDKVVIGEATGGRGSEHRVEEGGLVGLEEELEEFRKRGDHGGHGAKIEGEDGAMALGEMDEGVVDERVQEVEVVRWIGDLRVEAIAGLSDWSNGVFFADGKVNPIEGELSKSLLDNNKCYLLDCGAEVFGWVGWVTQVEERKEPCLAAEDSLILVLRMEEEKLQKEVTRLLEVDIIYPILDSEWVSPVQVVPKKSGVTTVKNEHGELMATRVQNAWRVCIDYRRLNQATRKDHYPLPFIDQMLDHLSGKSHYCFLDGYTGYFQIHIAHEDQEKTTFTCPFGTYAYKRMPFGLCNAPATFQRCMMSLFSNLIEDCMEVFMDDFSVYGDSFNLCLDSLSRVLDRCVSTNLVLNFEKCHFMVKQGIVLGHVVSNTGISVDPAKVDVISSLP
ncbi:uncharacterized protein LOC110265079, partial [Arachis ipaensis]|uniref:uncharacterized protein LOC110265079 n=1 Tax=Arachis ipaensis TaxID=130454 RepID=UPI000A2B5220